MFNDKGFYLFTFARIPVHFSIWFFIVMGVFAFQGDIARGILFAGCFALSILVHEFGHGFVARYYQLQPEITIHGFGGFCEHQEAQFDSHEALILIAGPGLGLLFGGLCFGISFVLGMVNPALLNQPFVSYAFDQLIYLAILWNVLNLIPMWPLDGGRLFRLFLIKVVKKQLLAERIAHGVGLVLSLGLALLAHRYFGVVGVFLCLFLAYENYRVLTGEARSGAVRASYDFANELLDKAEAAFAKEDWREATRYCHQLRADAHVHDRLLERVWQILAISTAKLKQYDEAAGYAKRAKPTFEMVDLWLDCLNKGTNKRKLRNAFEDRNFLSLSAKEQQTLKERYT